MLWKRRNYPPYNMDNHINNHESRLEVALAGFFTRRKSMSTQSMENFISKESKTLELLFNEDRDVYPQGIEKLVVNRRRHPRHRRS